MDFNLVNVILNGIFASIVAVLVTNIVFSLVARILNYDFIFAIETGRIMFDLDEEFYSDNYAMTRGILLHFAIALFIMFLYILVILPLLAIVLRMGPFIYETPSGTAIVQNLIWLGLLGAIIYLLWYSQDGNFDKFAFLLLLYFGTIIFLMATIFGLYIFGVPGILSF
jgi:hypothetical protein